MMTGKAAINVTPMIDVMLVLLIIYMVAVNSFGLDVAAPPESKEKTESLVSQDIVLRLRADGRVSLNREVIAADLLQPRLAEIHKTPGKHVVFVGADAELEFDQVVRVIDTARGVGFSKVALLPRGSF